MPVLDPLAGSQWRSDPDRLHYALRQLDTDPVRLAALLGVCADYRLGSYYERLWRALLDLAPDVHVLAHNVPVRQQRRSLGELDLVTETADGSVIHFELAIKFYLGQPELAGSGQRSPQSAWWGPDPKDRLDIKVDRLVTHQLPLAARQAGRLTHLPRIDRSCAWLQGCLFYPHSVQMAAAEQAHVPGWRHAWCYRNELEDAYLEQWVRLPHKRWLAPPVDAGQRNETSPSQTPAERPGAPLMLVSKARRDQPDAARLLVMPDGWPDRIIPPRCGSASGQDRA